MGSRGSIWFRLTWKMRDTPSGRRICARRASGRRTSGNDYGSWQTPSITETNEWPETKDARNARLRAAGQRKGCGSYKLSTQVLDLASWPTPTTRDHKDGSEQSCTNVPINALLGRAVHQATPGPTSSGPLPRWQVAAN
jgi:hypothetical protein